jgi:hypothetical protein
LIEVLVKKDPYRAFLYFYENPDRTALHSYPMLIHQNIKDCDLQKLGDFLVKSPPNSYKANYILYLAERWGRSDPAAALAWAANLQNAEDPTRRIYNSWAKVDPSAVAQLLSTKTDPNLRATLIRATFFGFAKKDPNAAISWLKTLPQNERIPNSISFISGLSPTHPAEAAALREQYISDPSLTTEQSAKLAISSSCIVEGWTEIDPVAAAKWVNQLPTGKGRDSATRALVEHVSEIDPASAFEWAETISEKRLRYYTVDWAIYRWGQNHPDAARAAIDRSNLTEQERAKLHRRIRRF